MFDTHAHLNDDAFDSIITQLLATCQARGVSKILIPGIDIATSRKAIDIAEKHDNVYAAVGIYPGEVNNANATPPKNLIETIHTVVDISTKVRAIGEIGLDRLSVTREHGEFKQEVFDQQCTLFEAQFRLAKEVHKSVTIHNRQAKTDLIRILENNWDAHYARNVVFHCCEPDKELLEFAIDHDIFIGVDGDVTFDTKKRAFVHNVPLNLLVIETDSPYLTPEPLRSDPATKFPNSPANLPLIAQAIADIKEEDPQTIKRITQENGMELFNLQ